MMNRGRNMHRKRTLKKPFKYTLCAMLFMALFLTYGLWPRKSNMLANPFANNIKTYKAIYTSCGTSPNATQFDAFDASQEYKYIYDITEYERELLLKLVYREANTESVECQIAVLQVVFNRMASDEFPDSIYDVVYQEGQFASIDCLDFDDTTYNETNIEALERTLKGERIIPDDILFFWPTSVDVNKPETWFYEMQQNNFYKQIDNTYFYY